MNKIDDVELKRIELDILKYVDSFCSENSINYSLSYGTLIGAIRHKGFIPWDDDIDIMMDRENYEKFLACFSKNENKKYKLISRKTSKNYNYMFSKIVDLDTILVEKHMKKVEDMGVYIDIFPIDSIHDDIKNAIKKVKKYRYMFYKGVASNWKHFFKNNNYGFVRQLYRFVFYLASRFSNKKSYFDKIEKKFPFVKNKKIYGCICGAYGTKELMDSNIFSEYINIEFEKMSFKSIKNYDNYLRNIYGDYMKLPPEEKRVSHHSFDAFLK